MARKNVLYSNKEIEEIERIVFEKIIVALTKRYHISVRDLNGWKLKAYQDEAVYGAGAELAFELKNFIVHGKKEVKETVDVPVTWIDHLKLDLNKWANKHLINNPFFFTNLAKAILTLKLEPKFKTIEKLTTYMRYCPHVNTLDNSCHIEFLQFKNVPLFGGRDTDEVT